MNNYIISEIKDKQNAKIESVGGKALHLIKMQEAQLAVPEFIVLSVDLVDYLLKPIRNEIEKLCSSLNIENNKELIDNSNHIQKLIRTIKIPSEISTQIYHICNEKFKENYYISVRSSAVSEDNYRMSFAGQHKSYLFVNKDNIFLKIIDSIASAWSFSALSYRLLSNESVNNIEYAVILQEMIYASKSGIAFSRNPKGNLDEAFIVAGYGLGEGIVGEKVETDSFRMKRSAEQFSSTIVEKKSQILYDFSTKSIIKKTTSSFISKIATLNFDELKQVYMLAIKCEYLLDTPADIEFSFDKNNKLFILQMRAITSINFNNIRILDNTNIVESYPNISLPLSFSFAINAYKNVFKNISSAFWISKNTIEKNSYLFDNLIAHYKGRIYYRLDNWYKMMAIIHTSKRSLKAWENAVGLNSNSERKQEVSIIHKVKIVISIIGLLLRYKSNNNKFYKEFEVNYNLLKSYDKDSSAKNLWTQYQTVSEQLFKPWHKTLINDFISFQSFSILQKLSIKYGISNKNEYANDLLCGTTGVESAKAVIEMLSIKDTIANNKSYSELFESTAEEILLYYNSDKYKNLFTSIKKYISEYGDRTLEELKLETPNLRQQPIIFIKLLKNQLKTSASKKSFIETQNKIHNSAIAQYTNILKWYNPKRYIFKIVYLLAAYGLKNRENMRFCRTKAYGLVKDIFLEIGKIMVKSGVIAKQRDVFYLTISNLEDFCINHNRESKVDLIAKTKKNYNNYENLQLPDRIIYVGDCIGEISKINNLTLNSSDVYTGIAVSKGKVQEHAIIIEQADFDISIAGRIMISKITDPGWVFLMAQSSGIISEKGSLLSHTAIVGRELGIPVIVGVTDATTIFNTGDLIEIDGDSGKVTLIEKV